MEAEQDTGNLDEIEVGHMVALQSDAKDDPRPFWIAKVTAVNKTSEEHIITIHWWQTQNQDAFERRYVPEYVTQETRRGRGRQSWRRRVKHLQDIDVLTTNLLA